MSLSKERAGELYIVAEAIIWGFFPVLALQSYKSVPPVFSAASCQLLSLICLFPLAYRKGDIRMALSWDVLKLILLSCFLVGVLFYSLVFIGSKSLPPVSVSILLLLEVPATYVVLRLAGKEKLSNYQMFGGLLVASSAAAVLYDGTFEVPASSLLIVLAVFVAPMGNYYNKEASRFISSSTFVFYRNLISSFFLFFLSSQIEELPRMSQVSESLWYLVPNGVIVFGLSKIFWVEGIKRIAVGKAISINAIFPIVTMAVAFLYLHEVPSIWQLIAVVPAIQGVRMLVTRDN